MKIYDISQELFSSRLFPGDKPASYERVSQIKNGDMVNLTTVNMSVHNGTHVDAPNHFIENGNSIDGMDLSKFVGRAKVVSGSGTLSAEDIHRFMIDKPKKILLKGNLDLSVESARAFLEHGVELIGLESVSIGPVDDPKPVHLVLLGAEIIALEGLDLKGVPDGYYFLSALPLKLAGSDGSPCRAVLIDWREEDLKINSNEITLKTLQDEDVPLFEKWLKQDYVFKWFCLEGEEDGSHIDAEAEMAGWLEQVDGRHTTHQHVKHFIVYLNGDKIGFCLYFDLVDEEEYLQEFYPDLAGKLNRNHTYEIGYLIGDKNLLGKGIGKIIVAKLEEELRVFGAKCVIGDPNDKNIPSVKALLANGFVKFKDNDYRKNL